MSAPSGTALSLAGATLIALGLCGLAETAWFWHVHTAPEEPVSVGSISNGSTSTFHHILTAKTGEERRHWQQEEEKERREAIEEGRRDLLRLRIRLYGAVPAGVLMILSGFWMLSATLLPRDGRTD